MQERQVLCMTIGDLAVTTLWAGLNSVTRQKTILTKIFLAHKG